MPQRARPAAARPRKRAEFLYYSEPNTGI